MVAVSSTIVTEDQRTRGHAKKERTRRKLIEAGIAVFSDRGAALTVHDVTSVADVSTGTFYNYFENVDGLIEEIAVHVATTIAAEAASDPVDDIALHFAAVTSRVLLRAQADPALAAAMLRILARSDSPRYLGSHLEADLAAGHAAGRFTLPPDEATLDLVSGLVVLTIRRIVDTPPDSGIVPRAVARALEALGVDRTEAATIAQRAQHIARETAGG